MNYYNDNDDDKVLLLSNSYCKGELVFERSGRDYIGRTRNKLCRLINDKM